MRSLILLILFTSSLFSNITLTDAKNCYKQFNIEYFYDPSNSVTIDNIEQQNFQTTNSNFTFGYRLGTLWFKLDIKNNSSKENYILSLSETLWKNFDLYNYSNGHWSVERNGLDIPLEKRTIDSIYPSFELKITPHTTKTYYIQAQTTASQLGQLELCNEKHYYYNLRFSIYHLYILFAFALLTILFINLYSYYLTNESIYLYYVAYTFTFIIFSSMQSGYYLLFGLEGWNEGLHVVGCFVLITLLLFSEKFLQIKEHMPIVYGIFQFSILIFFLFAILILKNIPYVNLFFNIYSIFFFVVLFYATIYTYMQGYFGVKYYLFALTIYVFTMGLMVLTFNTFIDYNIIVRHLFILGSFIEFVFFSLVLASKYKTIHLEKIKIQAELLKEKNKNEKVLKKAVEQRTKELEDAKAILEMLVITDHLTKTKNRRAYKEKLSQLLQTSKRYQTPFCMLIFDIDDFKAINDTYGHNAGDDVLVALTKLVAQNIRIVDHLFRIGGEEFVILLENTELEQAEVLAQKLLHLIEEKVDVIEDQKVTVSMGLTQACLDDTEDSIYKRVDNLLYHSKENGKNRISS